MKTKINLLVVVLMTGIVLQAQSKMNTLKTDLFALFFPSAVMKYERVLNEDITVQMGFLYGNIPPFNWSGVECEAKGFCITPEFRYFPFHNRSAPRGIYMAPNFRYQKFMTENLEESSEATVISNSPALNLGLQYALKDIFLLEAWIGIAYYIRKVVDETEPGAYIGYASENGVGPRGGLAIGILF